MGSALSTAQPFKFSHSCLRAPVGVHTRPRPQALTRSPHLEGLAPSRYTLHPPGFVENLKMIAAFPGRDFDLPRHSHYSGVISMVFQHSGSVHAYPGSSFPFQFVSGRMCVCVCVCTGLAPMDSPTSISCALEICSPLITKGNRPIKQYKGAEKGPRKWV